MCIRRTLPKDYWNPQRKTGVAMNLNKNADISIFLKKEGKDISSQISFYYIDTSVLLGTKPPVHSICHFIRDPSGVFSVCHLCECRIVQ